MIVKNGLILICVISAFLISPESNAAKVEVKWTNPDSYRDIHPGDENRKSYRAKLFKRFDKHFAKLASRLPKNQTLKIEVFDLDLAGDIDYGSIYRIRYVEDVYYPSIKFSYQLVNADNSTVKSGDINLKDVNFLQFNNTIRYHSQSYGYDKKMIADWFNKTFKDQFVKGNV